MTIVGTGYTWLREYVPYFAAAAVKNGWNKIVGLGRGGFAYPDFAKDIVKTGRMDPGKVCVSCSSCTQIMRDKGRTGCVPRDPEIYAPIYREGRWRDPAYVRRMAAQCRDCFDPGCVEMCPAKIDIPGFLKEMADGNEREAYRILRRTNLLSEICGCVCPVETLCEGNCIERLLGEGPVHIARIQRYISERAVDEGWTTLEVPVKDTGKRVAIAGAGPAGLACAAALLEEGHQVVLIERSARAGGKAITVIPDERMPLERATAEIHSIFKSIGPNRLAWRWNTSLGPNYTVRDIMDEGFDAIALTFGLGNTASLVSDESRPEGVIDALGFLTQMNRNTQHRIEGKVAVIGGGNTAFDAATIAKERGAPDVYLIYRRSYQEMPAWPYEREKALELGIHIILLTQPIAWVTDSDGILIGVRVERTELSEPDESGRRRPVAIEGTEHVIPVSMGD